MIANIDVLIDGQGERWLNENDLIAALLKAKQEVFGNSVGSAATRLAIQEIVDALIGMK